VTSASTAPVIIRRARAGEATRLRELVQAAYARYVPRIGQPPAPMRDDYQHRIDRDEAWVLEREGRIDGALVLEDSADSLLLDNVAVAPAYQGQGLGRQLIAFAEAEARRRGWPTVQLYTNVRMVENIRLYARLGFGETGRGVQNGFERVFMEKRLIA
jgi:ribosomal protein S18 acetylase RimI-like enzyme